ncbi:nitrile hydratase accessory protein [Xanthobacter dioxanivorans]|uniref:Nitrile hydratase accessory protein n=1 Tax=Xanthobacter dioxanivorans TaxID=2528964 RepID=A0A974SK18_9HYPH|nr:nitrile hydratase accessory protein [Xanthobacter dioxanivorans]QRG07043.1 nitrile hydratase accessory protein [Xanthobacter dioxanivorans]
MSHQSDASSHPEPPPGGAVFQEPWQARVFALAVCLNRAGLFSWMEWTEALVARTKASPSGEASYELWLDTLEELLISRAATDRAVLDALREAWRAAGKATPHGQPIELAPGILEQGS